MGMPVRLVHGGDLARLAVRQRAVDHAVVTGRGRAGLGVGAGRHHGLGVARDAHHGGVGAVGGYVHHHLDVGVLPALHTGAGAAAAQFAVRRAGAAVAPHHQEVYRGAAEGVGLLLAGAVPADTVGHRDAVDVAVEVLVEPPAAAGGDQQQHRHRYPGDPQEPPYATAGFGPPAPPVSAGVPAPAVGRRARRRPAAGAGRRPVVSVARAGDAGPGMPGAGTGARRPRHVVVRCTPGPATPGIGHVPLPHPGSPREACVRTHDGRSPASPDFRVAQCGKSRSWPTGLCGQRGYRAPAQVNRAGIRPAPLISRLRNL